MKSSATVIAVVFSVVNTLSANPFQAQATQEKVEALDTLKLGEPQQRTLAPDVIHVWSLTLEKGQYVVVEVEQKGIDVVVRIVDPTGARRGEFDSPTDTSGTEKASWVTNNAGTWKVEIVPLEATHPGDYEIKLALLHDATEKDRQIVEADSLKNLAVTYDAQGRYSDAAPLYERYLRIQEGIFGPDHLNIAQDLNNLAEIYRREGKYFDAEPLYKRALTIREKIFGAEHSDVATSLNNFGVFHYDQGKYIEAESLYRRALTVRERNLGPEHRDVAKTLNNLAILYNDLGKYVEAEPLYKRSLKIFEKILGPEHPIVAQCLNNLAVLYTVQRKYAEAEQLYRRSLAVLEKALGPEHPYVAQSLNNLAGFYLERNKYDESELMYKQCLTILEKTFGPEHAYLALSLHNLAGCYLEQGKYGEAETTCKHSLSISEKTLGPEHPEVASNLQTLAMIYAKQGKFEEVEPLYMRSLKIREEILGPKHPDVAVSLYNLAEFLYTQMKYVDAALPLIKRSIDILDSTTAYLDKRINAYALRAQMHKQKVYSDDAFADLAEALQSTEQLRPQIGGGEEIQAGFFEKYTDHFNCMVTWQLEAGQIEQALAYAERGRARVMLDQLAVGQVDLRNRVPADIRLPLEQRETDAKARIAEFQQRLRLLPSRKDFSNEQRNREITTSKDSLRTAEQDYQQVYEEIKQASPLWRELITSGGRPVALADIQTHLVPENSLMLLYQIGKEESYVFVIPPAGQKPEVISLQVPDKVASILEVEIGPLKSTALQKILVDQDTTKSGQGLLDYLRSRGTDATQTKSASAKLHALWQVLVPASLWSRLVASSEVIIIPDGVLNLLPFEALVVQTGSKPSQTRHWLDEGPVIRYAPSATTLFNLEQRQVSASATLASALSLSDPIFDPKTVAQAMQQKNAKKPAASHDSSQANSGEPDSLSVFAATRGTFERASGALLRLEATARETEEIQKAFGRKSVVALMRLEANEPKLRAELAGKRYLHLATHGIVEEQRSAMFAALALTPPPNETNVAENDGFLQLYEIYDLKLPDCELAVLSACKTSFGRYFEGEGVFALSRGFLAAGAARVIASHWDVDDKSTAELIGAFFRQIAAGEKADRKLDYAHALREAKRKVRNQEQWTAPYYWAPFVLTGKR